jgi:hypothetical protein
MGNTHDPMRCGGCGAKVGSTTVSGTGAGPPTTDHSSRAAGVEAPPPIDHDDAAVMPLPKANGHGGALDANIDYFPGNGGRSVYLA